MGLPESQANTGENYLKKALVDWLTLWLIYNAVLLTIGTIGLLYLASLIPHARYVDSRLKSGEVWAATIFLFAVFANVGFALGPLADAYAYVLFDRRLRAGRYVLFATGLLFAIFCALAFLAGARSLISM